MSHYRLTTVMVLSATLTATAQDSKLPGIDAAMQAVIAKNEVAGAVTAVVTKDKVLDLETIGYADVAAKRPMSTDTLFWIASMTKPVTGVAVLMLQDEGKLSVADPVAKYLPEFANLKTPSGKPANLTMTQILTHTSGLGEASGPAAQSARTLADLVPIWLAAPMQYEPGAQWKYTQSGINAAARIVEVVSGMTFDVFVQKRIFDPLGMKDTTFYPTDAQRARLATAYAKNKDTGVLEAGAAARRSSARATARRRATAASTRRRPTTRDSAQMLLNGGTLGGQHLPQRRRDEVPDDARRPATSRPASCRPTSTATVARTTAGASPPASCARRTTAWRRCCRRGPTGMAAPGARRRGSIR